MMKILLGVTMLAMAFLATAAIGWTDEEELWVVYPGGDGPGKGKADAEVCMNAEEPMVASP